MKFFSDLITNTNIDASRKAFARREAARYLDFIKTSAQNITLPGGPYHERNDILRAMAETGRATVQCRLVDSYFGNISYFDGSSIFISQTASSLDELAGAIDECPVDGSSCAGITASSEFTAHRDIYTRAPVQAVLHGHPKFSVIMSMRCEKSSCEFEGQCHKRCPEKRFIGDVPIVPGEIGTGTYGLCNTLPPALVHSRGAMVFGHGLFTTGKTDFTEAFSVMVDIEMMCAKRYIETLDARDIQI